MNKVFVFLQSYPITNFLIRRYLIFGGCLILGFYLFIKLLLTTNMVLNPPIREEVVDISYSNMMIPNLPKSSNFRKYFYVRSIFRVTDNEIRISLVKSSFNNLTLFYTYGRKQGEVTLICHLRKCPDKFSPPCEINGYVGLIKDLSFNDIEESINLYSTSIKDSCKIQITDVRYKTQEQPYETSDYPHKLGVCLQPIYLLTDYTLIIQFFEYWLNEGATKFYIYWESFSPEVKDMIKFYMKTSNASIELVSWSRLPSAIGTENDLNFNPNAFWFRLEVYLSLFDCIHRARYKVKYIAQSDLDEMFYVKNNKTLFEYLEEMNDRSIRMGQILFRSKRAYLSTNITDISNPIEYPFKAFKEFKADKQSFPPPYYIKIIYRPERNFLFDIHRSNKLEEIFRGSLKYFKPNYASPEEANVFHFRRLKDQYGIEGIEETVVFSKTTEIWKNNFNKRLQIESLSFRQRWKNFGLTFGKELDQCRNIMFNNRLKQCHSLYACEIKLNATSLIKLIRANNSWYFF